MDAGRRTASVRVLVRNTSEEEWDSPPTSRSHSLQTQSDAERILGEAPSSQPCGCRRRQFAAQLILVATRRIT